MNCLYTIPLCNFSFAFRHAICVIVKDFGKALSKTKSPRLSFHTNYPKGNSNLELPNLYRITPLSYHEYSVSTWLQGHPLKIPLKILRLFPSIHVLYKNFSRQSVIKVSNQYRTRMTFNHKIQAKIFHMAWHVILCSIGYIDVPNKGIEQACSWASLDIHISPFSINLHFTL